MATSPAFATTPNIGQARLAAANTARDGSGTLSTLFTAGASGSRVERIVFVSAQATAAASSAMVGRIFVTDNAGINPHLRAEVAFATLTPSTTAIGATMTFTFSGGLILKSGQLLKCAISVYAGVADQMDVYAEGGDF